jgi:hypothetical protein
MKITATGRARCRPAGLDFRPSTPTARPSASAPASTRCDPDRPDALYPDAEPLNAPGWFDCFDAAAIGADLARGEAVAFLGQENVPTASTASSRSTPTAAAFAWHQINACGEVVFDGARRPRAARPPRKEPEVMPDLLIELLSEEIPARMQARAAEDLRAS